MLRGQHRDLRSFGGTHVRRDIEVFAPRCEEQLQQLVSSLASSGRRTAALGASLSFDGQGLPDETAVDLRELAHVCVDPERRVVRVGAGARAGQALFAALEHGLTIPVLPSTSRVTMAGSASSDAYSRMTPGLGRESRYIRSLRLVTGDGRAVRCSREHNHELFYAAIGGFGLVGFITELEYELLEVGPSPALISSAHAFEGFDGLRYLIPEHTPPELPPGIWPGCGAVVISHGHRHRTLLSRHRFASTQQRRPTIAHRTGPARVAAELLVREFPGLASWLWLSNWVPRRPVGFIDDLAPATFFMDGHLDAHRVGLCWGRDPVVMQQSFVLPVADRLRERGETVSAFVRDACTRFAEHRIRPAMFDVGFLPAAEPFGLSSNCDHDAFLVSAAFLAGPRQTGETIARALTELTGICREVYGGKLHLTKQAHCEDAVLRADYAEAIERVRALRRIHDPRGVITTALGHRLGL
jgi:hypothetical protein